MTSFKKDTLLFICSPSLGIIDSWLPVLHKIKEIDKDREIVCLIPKTRTVEEIDLDKTLIQIANKLFSLVVFKSSQGHWLAVENFEEAVKISSETIISHFLRRKLQRLPKNKLFYAPKKLGYSFLNILTHLKEWGKRFEWDENSQNVTAILYDVYVEKKKHVNQVLKNFKDIPKYSISHGLKVKNINEWRDEKNGHKKNITAFIHSEHEIGFFRDRFGVPECNQRVVGVPRHQPDWIRLLINKEKKDVDFVEEEFIFIISRPHTTDYHPKKRMRKALQHIKKLAWGDLNRKLVVKLHPKESVTGIYEEVFGSENYGKKWVYSDLHPFILGEKCLFAIAFYSGVVVDMIALDVPTIELLDLRGLPKYDNGKALRDENGDPVFEYRYNALTLGANDYEDLKKHVNLILSNPENVMQVLKQNYQKLYPTQEKVRKRIADEILSTQL